MADNTLLKEGDYVSMVLVENAVAFGDASEDAIGEYRRTIINREGDCDVLMLTVPAGRGKRLQQVLYGIIRIGGAITGGTQVRAGCPWDTDGDGHCGRRGCRICGGPPA